eukprot:CAMPEP_0113232866 /NCGR_PEP_ID=MMETSP0008_2-20120614/2178_1 /TAXON_ID=97485 /ORGANISM="Prymnesium parvum" /LENGTH=557 /DNA_ID=CAMNT_0000079609 /DNA_START=1 /DNA_END=1670 /DNA_ORIENTATION=+ /assembly_acc=CAM_ASM_000153
MLARRLPSLTRHLPTRMDSQQGSESPSVDDPSSSTSGAAGKSFLGGRPIPFPPGLELTEEEADSLAAELREEEGGGSGEGGSTRGYPRTAGQSATLPRRRPFVDSSDDGYELVGEGYRHDDDPDAITADMLGTDTQQLALGGRSPYQTLWQREMLSLNSEETQLKRMAAQFISAVKKEHEDFWADSQPWLYEDQLRYVSPFGSTVREPPSFTDSSNVLGTVLLHDASVMWHNVIQPSPSTICLYWTIEFTVALLPWRPQCVWTGMTRWTLNETSGKAMQQEDFWDSINLRGGAYRRQLLSGFAAWYDVLGQLSPRPPRPKHCAQATLAYTTLRRANGYEVRRYDACTVAQAPYQLWQSGLNVLSRYTERRNEERRQVACYLPLFLELARDGGQEKTMVLPLRCSTPAPATDASPAAETDMGAASAMESWLRALPRTGVRLVSPLNSSLDAAQETAMLTDERFPSPLANDYTILQDRPSVVVVVGAMVGEWEDGDAAQQRATALEALASADGLTVSPEKVLVAQYNIGFASSRSAQEVMLVLDDHPWIEEAEGDAEFS